MKTEDCQYTRLGRYFLIKLPTVMFEGFFLLCVLFFGIGKGLNLA